MGLIFLCLTGDWVHQGDAFANRLVQQRYSEAHNVLDIDRLREASLSGARIVVVSSERPRRASRSWPGSLTWIS